MYGTLILHILCVGVKLGLSHEVIGFQTLMVPPQFSRDFLTLFVCVCRREFSILHF